MCRRLFSAFLALFLAVSLAIPALADEVDDSFSGNEGDFFYIQENFSNGISTHSALTPIDFYYNRYFGNGSSANSFNAFVRNYSNGYWTRYSFSTNTSLRLQAGSNIAGSMVGITGNSYAGSGSACGFEGSVVYSTFTYTVPSGVSSISLQGSFQTWIKVYMGYNNSVSVVDRNFYATSVSFYGQGVGDPVRLGSSVANSGVVTFNNQFNLDGFSSFYIVIQFSGMPTITGSASSTTAPVPSNSSFVRTDSYNYYRQMYFQPYISNASLNFSVSDSTVSGPVDVDMSDVTGAIDQTNSILNQLIPLVQQTNTILSGSVVSALQNISSSITTMQAAIVSNLNTNFGSLKTQMTTEFTALKTLTSSEFSALKTLMSSEFSTLNQAQQTRADFLNEHLTAEFSTTNTNLVGSDRSTTFSSYLFDAQLNRSEQTTTVTNILDALGWIGSEIQKPLSQLQAVLADDDDLRLKQETQEYVDAVTDDFTGSGSAAPSTDDIGDMAGISADFSGMFDSGVGAGDLMGAINGEDTYSFFSQETSDALDTTGNAGISTVSDMVDDILDLSGYEETEDGLYVPSGGLFSIDIYLGRGE